MNNSKTFKFVSNTQYLQKQKCYSTKGTWVEILMYLLSILL